VIGYGSPLRSDDGAGWVAAQELASTVRDPQVHILWRHQLAPELAEVCSQAELVIFIDAATGSDPGKIACVPVSCDDPAARSQTQSCSHHATPATILSLSKTLYGRAPRSYVLSIVGESFALGENLSPTVQASLPELLKKALALIGSPATHEHKIQR
jgi:hydrogenase maturation protease